MVPIDKLNVGADPLLFTDQTVNEAADTTEPPWKVLVVDDETEIHSVTNLVLKNFTFEGRKLELLHAYNGEEAIRQIREHPDVAVILLDVVMETENTGLDIVKYIREDIDNHQVRIVLRTGQPGQVPEREVIARYDINDYKEKTELTANKLFTVIYSSLRSYRDLINVVKHQEAEGKLLRSFALFANQKISFSDVLSEIADAGSVFTRSPCVDVYLQ